MIKSYQATFINKVGPFYVNVSRFCLIKYHNNLTKKHLCGVYRKYNGIYIIVNFAAFDDLMIICFILTYISIKE